MLPWHSLIFPKMCFPLLKDLISSWINGYEACRRTADCFVAVQERTFSLWFVLDFCTATVGGIDDEEDCWQKTM